MRNSDSPVTVESPCQACAATATAAAPYPARSAWRRRAAFMRYVPKCAAPACPAMPNARWRGEGTGCRCWSSSLRTQGPIPRDLSVRHCDRRFLEQITFGGYGSLRSQGRHRLRRDSLAQILIEVVVDRREGRERLGRKRDRLAVTVGR